MHNEVGLSCSAVVDLSDEVHFLLVQGLETHKDQSCGVATTLLGVIVLVVAEHDFKRS